MRANVMIKRVLSALCVLVSLLSGAAARAQTCDEAFQQTSGLPIPGADFDVLSASAAPQFFSVNGTGFIPSNSSITWNYGNFGCILPTAAGYWRAPINIPDGSVITHFYFTYRNSATSDSSTGWVTRYQTNGDYADLKSLPSLPGATTGDGYFTADVAADTTTSIIIDNQQNSYVFIWGGSTTQRLCSMRIEYTLPTTTSTSTTTTIIPACVDDDGDGYGENCDAGPDCNDNDTFYNTTCPDPGCTLKIMPKALGLFLGEKTATRTLIFRAENGTFFDENTPIKWDNSGLAVLSRHVVSPQFMLLKVRIDGAALDKGEYRLLAGSCTGTLTLVK